MPQSARTAQTPTLIVKCQNSVTSHPNQHINLTISMTVKSTVNYLAPMALWEDTKPYEITGNVSADVPRTNFKFEPRDVEVQDARALPSEVSLSTHGFEWVTQTTTEDLKTDDSVTRRINELEEIFQDYFKADKVLTFRYQVK
ncbi:methyltransferase like protein [Fusarium circinatum]|uniref:Methyltransferase like protein n=1 Tax=Fusarium circinatum TaxID=48490 RepID=A0A8H5X238_FUSCI|nr:methyltransferase like protein [Fusarium circinatum]